jgi:hypothetical protein
VKCTNNFLINTTNTPPVVAIAAPVARQYGAISFIGHNQDPSGAIHHMADTRVAPNTPLLTINFVISNINELLCFLVFVSEEYNTQKSLTMLEYVTRRQLQCFYGLLRRS